MEKREKLPMCRVCLAENVRMYKVVNRNLHKLYEKLTDIPFITEDSRPILACFFCCTKLKQCYQLLRQCVEAKDLLAQRMNEDYELNPLINQHRLQLFSGFIKSPIEHISIVGECQTESIAVKEEVPVVFEGVDDVIEPKEEHQSDELNLENLDNSCLDVADIPSHHSESDVEDDEPLMKLKPEAEGEEVSTKTLRVRDTKKLDPEYLNNSCLDVAHIPPHHSESDVEEDEPLMELRTEREGEEVSKKKRRVRDTKRATVAKKPKLDTQRTKLEDAITDEQTKKEKSDSKVLRTTQKRTSKPGTYYKEPHKCDVCQRSFSHKSHLSIHTRIHTGEKPFKCDVCQHSFRVKRHLTNHIRIHTGEKPYKCNICQHSFSENCHLKKHILIHTGEKPYQCDVCQRSFRVKRYLTDHIRIHTGEKPYKCHICQRSFSDKRSLTKHIGIHTGQKPYKCDVCKRSFSTNNYLKIHIRIHTGEKPYKCDVCQSSFKRNSILKKHISIHTGEKPYKCDVCQRSFRVKRYLKDHIQIHNGKKPYNCHICLRSFSVNCLLKKHIRIHTGEKPYKCDVCQRSFTEKTCLTRHTRIHTGDKPYKCDICQRSFKQEGQLTRHIRIHTCEKSYKCDVCQRSFIKKGNLSVHIRTHTV